MCVVIYLLILYFHCLGVRQRDGAKSGNDNDDDEEEEHYVGTSWLVFVRRIFFEILNILLLMLCSVL